MPDQTKYFTLRWLPKLGEISMFLGTNSWHFSHRQENVDS